MNRIYSSDEIDVLVYQYKKTRKDIYLQELLKAFEGYVIKYMSFLKYGHYKTTDKDIISLIKMVRQKNINTISFITSLFSDWETNDMLNELNLLFINLVISYVKIDNGPHFSGYLYACYKFAVKRFILEVSNYARQSENVTFLDDNDKFVHEDFTDMDFPLFADYEHICLTEKTDLNQLEKQILYLHYGKKISIKNIAVMFGLTRWYVNHIKKMAFEKIKKHGITKETFQH